VRDPEGFYEEMATLGDVVTYSMLWYDFTALLHPDHVEEVLMADDGTFGKWGFEQFSGDFGADGLVATEGEQWRRQRTALQDAFTMDRIRTYAEEMPRYAAEAVADWDDGEEIRLERELSDLTLRVLANSLLNVDLSEGGEQVTRFAEVMNELGDARNLASFTPLWVPLPSNRRFRRRRDAVAAFIDDVVERRRGRAGEADDILSILLTAADEDGRGLDESEVEDNVMTFLMAGHETTSLALTYALLSVATHDDVHERLREEHRTVLDGDLPTFADVPQLTYTGRVVKEALRLYPPAYIMFRQAHEDVAVGGHRIPEESIITLPVRYIQTDEQWYDDPMAFRPDRWDGDLERENPDYAYYPFGGGPRHCIGMRFAMTELKTMLPAILQRVDLELLSDPDPDLSMGVTLRPDDPVRMQVSRR
jgi:cytochrome P450